MLPYSWFLFGQKTEKNRRNCLGNITLKKMVSKSQETQMYELVINFCKLVYTVWSLQGKLIYLRY